MLDFEYDEIFECGELLGKSKVVKNSWYEVWEYNTKVYAVLLLDTMSAWVESVQEINRDQIGEYV